MLFPSTLRAIVSVSLLGAIVACGARPAPTGAQPTAATNSGSEQSQPAATQQAAAGQTAGATRVFNIVPEESEASYDVQEKLAFLPLPSRAVGKTKAIDGQFTLTLGPQPQVDAAHFSVDLLDPES